MIIEKKQTDIDRFRFNWSYFSSAREGFKSILQTRGLKGKKILLPAYIGYSTREGSGVFDPIRETGKEYSFYKLGGRLDIDMADVMKMIKKNRNNILLIIHYFGFMDRNLKALKEYARRYNMIIIEDFAQALFTFFLRPVLDFDYAFFSIHKLFPSNSGGLVIGKRKIRDSLNNGASRFGLFSYDIKGITEKRVENYQFILDRLEKVTARYNIDILRRNLNGTIPQTFPLLVSDRTLRDRLYFQMNKTGYGVVSLYHTLIDEIDSSFTVSHGISDRIINLPVHQDAERRDLGIMTDIMLKTINNHNRNKR